MKTKIFKFASLLLMAGLLSSFNLILNVNNCYSQNFDWANGYGASGFSDSYGFAVDADASGNVYSAGEFNGTVNFGGIILTGSADNTDIFVTKHNSAGVIQWAQRIGSGYTNKAYSIICDNAGDIYVLVNVNRSFILHKYNSNGVILWTQDIDNGTIRDYQPTFYYYNMQKIAVDNSGNCYVSGSFDNTATVGSTVLNSAGGSDVYVAKYNSSGIFQWAKSGGSVHTDEGTGIATDASGNVYITGHYFAPVNFGSISLSNVSSGVSTFIVKYNSSGTEISGITTDGPGNCYGRGIGTDAAGNIYISGIYSGNVTFGAVSISGGLSNFFIAKYNSSGGIEWVKNEGQIYNFSTYGNTIKTDAFGNSFVCGNYAGSVSFDGFTLTGTGSFIVKYNNSGNVQSATKVNSGIGGFNNLRGISSDIYGNSYITGGFTASSTFGNIVLNSSGNGSNIFIAKINNITNRMSGNVFIDYDNDGIRDIGEPPYWGEIISFTPENLTTVSNSFGNYDMFCGMGNFNSQITNLPLYYSVNPVMHNSNFSSYGNIDADNNFGLHPSPGKNDLRITMTDNSLPIPGFDITHTATYENIGTTTQSGIVEIIYDARTTFLPSLTNPLPSRVDVINHKLEWDYVNLTPHQTENIIIGYKIPPAVSLGSILSTDVKINSSVTDLTPIDNQETLIQTVIGSFDPNDKSVSPSGGITPQQVSNEEPLTYTIRFQNTGTYAAFTVVVMDTLSPNLNAASIEVLSASHDYSFSVSGNGSLRWKFDNIMLPDVNTNEPLSHGFIKYRVKPKNNLAIGDEIQNTAYIFFDYNEPVITNTTVTQVEASKDIQIHWRSEGMFPHSDATVIQLRRAVAPYDIIKSAAGISTNQFIIPPIYTLTATVSNLLSGSYYFVIKHRNSIETWSANPVTISPNGTTYYDFTTNQSKAYGNNMKLTGSVWSVYSGDVDQNGSVDLTDEINIYNDASSFTTGYKVTDLNGNNIVDLSDLLIANNNSANFVYVKRP